MRNLRTRLPPLNSLVAFEASARLLSFTGAGRELGVSREAVSRQIRILESHLGAPLFERRHRSLELTAAGTSFSASVARHLDGIARAASALGRDEAPARVAVTATVAIASFWLTPRLPGFRAAHPGLEIRIAVSDAPVEEAMEGADLGLRYGAGQWAGLSARHLFDVDSSPVCTPGYLETAPPLRRPADLTDHSLLNLDGTAHALEDWRWWLDGAGVRQTGKLAILGFDNYANVIQAALDGQGVALGFGGVVDELLTRGDLVRPLAERLSKGGAVYLVTDPEAPLSPSARDFHDWVLAEAGG